MPSSFYAYRSICNALGESLVQILDLDEIGAAGDTCVRACRNDDLVVSSCQVRRVRHCDCGAKDVVDTFELLVDPDDVCTKSRPELLQGVQPIVDDSGTIGIRGVVTDIVQGKDGITMLVEGKLEHDTSFDKASVTVNMKSTVLRGNTTITGLFAFSEIRKGDTVEVTFDGPVAESYPVQGTAATVRILIVP
jgi:hypothetical protein